MEKEKNKLYCFFRIIYSILLKILFRPQIKGKENIPEKGAIIFAGNHKNAIDPIMVMSNTKRIVHFMAKEELFKGIHGYILKKIGIIKIYRKKSNPIAIMDAEKILNNEGTIGIFPEGTRNRTDTEILKFRYGTVKIAQKTNSKIIPFVIKGKYKLFRKNIKIEFGEMIDISQMNIEDANNFLQEKVLELLRK